MKLTKKIALHSIALSLFLPGIILLLLYFIPYFLLFFFPTSEELIQVILHIPDPRFLIVSSLALFFIGASVELANINISLSILFRVKKEELPLYLLTSLFSSYFIWKSFAVFSKLGYAGLVLLFIMLSVLFPLLIEYLSFEIQAINKYYKFFRFHRKESYRYLKEHKLMVFSVFVILVLFYNALFITVITVDRSIKAANYRKLRLSLNPTISQIQPSYVYQSTKVIIKGKAFGWNTNNKSHLLKGKEIVHTDLWNDTKIQFTVPLHWKEGKISLHIAKPIIWEGKKLVATSEAVIIKLLPRSEKMTPDDDKYFEQLKSLDPEVLELNGYDVEQIQRTKK